MTEADPETPTLGPPPDALGGVGPASASPPSSSNAVASSSASNAAPTPARPARPQQNPRNRRTRNAPPPPPTSAVLRSRVTYISPTSHIILKLPSGRLRSADLQPGKQVHLGKFGSFSSDDIIGMPFGFTYEIANDGALKMVMNSTLAQLEETDATNENIHDDGTAQKLTYVDIQALKEAGITGREIIQKQLEGSETFGNRTVYSQAKYVQRKEQKHLKLFTPLAPDFGTVCQYNFEKHPDKVRWMRPDALSQCLSFASVRPGGRYLVVDGISGLLTGAVLERLGGDGLVLAINDAESPPAFDVLSQFNLPDHALRQTLKVVHWAATEEDYRPVFVGQEEQIQAIDGLAGGAAGKGQGKKAKDKGRERKRQATQREVERNRAEFFKGDFDALLVACHYQPHSILQRLKGAIGGSGSVVVHSPYLQPLTECHSHLRASEEFVNVSVTEPWLRRYQVLPGRTHPEMTTSATGGYILHALRVLPEDEARALKEARRAELEAAAAAAATAIATEGNVDGAISSEGTAEAEALTATAALDPIKRREMADEGGEADRERKRAKVEAETIAVEAEAEAEVQEG